ncbi:hypothetical protein SAMD00019534_021760 [Acytostelium subglobosum LB1]|uniref:hypothetical protein n=1 Tax=Acytostelium subglobosum LB1 TaxID=1410327 RepID=UPI000644E2AA|nr:hypothetical protein SAMD00019534_021760 [Acytostelium subglobosum LB1]GAM19001.1 hypothetical protein SAMD00019534_021760 [Acytostelium subglobosum LB1]|eukprot:XP_012756928.1 hypothetical protein SAMD00019534_021760 [Acytostelium subglobosum LB1]
MPFQQHLLLRKIINHLLLCNHNDAHDGTSTRDDVPHYLLLNNTEWVLKLSLVSRVWATKVIPFLNITTPFLIETRKDLERFARYTSVGVYHTEVCLNPIVTLQAAIYIPNSIYSHNYDDIIKHSPAATTQQAAGGVFDRVTHFYSQTFFTYQALFFKFLSSLTQLVHATIPICGEHDIYSLENFLKVSTSIVSLSLLPRSTNIILHSLTRAAPPNLAKLKIFGYNDAKVNLMQLSGPAPGRLTTLKLYSLKLNNLNLLGQYLNNGMRKLHLNSVSYESKQQVGAFFSSLLDNQTLEVIKIQLAPCLDGEIQPYKPLASIDDTLPALTTLHISYDSMKYSHVRNLLMAPNITNLGLFRPSSSSTNDPFDKFHDSWHLDQAKLSGVSVHSANLLSSTLIGRHLRKLKLTMAPLKSLENIHAILLNTESVLNTLKVSSIQGPSDASIWSNFFSVVSKCSTLNQLSVVGSDVNEASVAQFINGLPPTIRHLCFSENIFRSFATFGALMWNQTLKSLCLKGCYKFNITSNRTINNAPLVSAALPAALQEASMIHPPYTLAETPTTIGQIKSSIEQINALNKLHSELNNTLNNNNNNNNDNMGNHSQSYDSSNNDGDLRDHDIMMAGEGENAEDDDHHAYDTNDHPGNKSTHPTFGYIMKQAFLEQLNILKDIITTNLSIEYLLIDVYMPMPPGKSSSDYIPKRRHWTKSKHSSDNTDSTDDTKIDDEDEEDDDTNNNNNNNNNTNGHNNTTSPFKMTQAKEDQKRDVVFDKNIDHVIDDIKRHLVNSPNYTFQDVTFYHRLEPHPMSKSSRLYPIIRPLLNRSKLLSFQ